MAFRIRRSWMRGQLADPNQIRGRPNVGRFRDLVTKLADWDFALQLVFIVALVLAGILVYILDMS